MRVNEFDFPLPDELIATRPAGKRGDSRMLTLRRDTGAIGHRAFSDLPQYIDPGDMLLLNNTRVLPCRLRGTRQNGRGLEVLLVRPLGDAGDNRWEVLSPGGYTGELHIAPGVSASMQGGLEAVFKISPEAGSLRDVLMEYGMMPIPPYLKRSAHEEDRNWYQTEYAEVEGSIAAPTAGLHFTRPMLSGLRDKGVLVRYLTLHVGKGTFMPMRADTVEEHRMESEFFEIQRELLEEIASLKGRLITVGTTSTRAVESAVSGEYEPVEGAPEGVVRGSTGIFISPGYEFRAVQALLTNFHLPRSTPLMLASALAGRDKILQAYTQAIEKSYGFFSYGDAMLIY